VCLAADICTVVAEFSSHWSTMANGDPFDDFPAGLPLQPELQIVEQHLTVGGAHALVTSRIANLQLPRRGICRALNQLSRLVRGK